MDSHATDQCHDKHACGRREQLRNPDRLREVEAEERDLGGVFVDEHKVSRTSKTPPTLTPAHVSAIRVRVAPAGQNGAAVSPADASRSMSTTPSARSWKFPVSKMKHYLTWWANSMQSRCNPLRALGMLRDRPADHEKSVREAPGAVDGVARVLGGKKDLGANITKVFDGATDREKARPHR
jgi:hypothetical protein